MAVITSATERQIMTEFLELYREFPCLWCPVHALYSNREAREQAYEVLLEKFKILQEDANIDTIRKKIDNMRCSYKRERKKVLQSIAEGVKEYRPSLWYYKLLKFIDDPYDDSQIRNSHHSSDPNESQDLEDDYEYEDECHESPMKKKLKTEIEEPLFIPELNEVDETVTQSQRETLVRAGEHEAAAFGRTVGLQLKELEPMQRFIAEKLISEIIFYARLDKLNTQSNVSLNQDY